MTSRQDKNAIRDTLRGRLQAMTPADRHAKSVAACSLVTASPEFAAAKVVMLYLSMVEEVDTAPIALRCWQTSKTVVVPKVLWQQRRMLPVEVTSLTTGVGTSPQGVREPITGNPFPTDSIDLVIVPGLGFSLDGYRIGRGMGFYDRFLSSDEFLGAACGLGFEEQVVEKLPAEPHDVPVTMLATDRGLRRFVSQKIQAH
jgi:5-formyltetrahydrofolate cyclo-ligase